MPILNKIIRASDSNGVLDEHTMPSIVRIEPSGSAQQSHTETGSEEIEDAVDAQPGTAQPKYAVGTAVLKSFYSEEDGKGQPFAGEVKSYDSEEGLYLVRYKDGDEEEMKEPELSKIVNTGKTGDQTNSLSDSPAAGQMVAHEMLGSSVFRGIITEVSNDTFIKHYIRCIHC